MDARAWRDVVVLPAVMSSVAVGTLLVREATLGSFAVGLVLGLQVLYMALAAPLHHLLRRARPRTAAPRRAWALVIAMTIAFAPFALYVGLAVVAGPRNHPLGERALYLWPHFAAAGLAAWLTWSCSA